MGRVANQPVFIFEVPKLPKPIIPPPSFRLFADNSTSIFESQNTQLMKMFTRGRTPSFLETTSFAYLLINEHFCLIIKHTDLNSERQNRGTVSSNRTLTVSVLSQSLNSQLAKLQTAPIWSTIWIASKLPAGLVRVHRGMISPL